MNASYKICTGIRHFAHKVAWVGRAPHSPHTDDRVRVGADTFGEGGVERGNITPRESWVGREPHLPHTDYRVRVGPDAFGEGGIEVGLGRLQPLVLHDRFHRRVDRVQFVHSEDVRHVARV